MTTDPLAAFRDLRRSRGRAPLFVVEGEIGVRRLLASGHDVVSVVATPTHLARLSVPAHVTAHTRDESQLRELVGFDFHRGCLACARRPPHHDAGSVIDALDTGPATRLVVAENVADPANLGALVRNCSVFGVDLVVVDGRGADPLGRRAIRASAATVLTQPLACVESATVLVAELRRRTGWRVVAADADPDATPLPWVLATGPLALLVGNEGQGLTPTMRDLAHERVVIPMASGADSLNVAAATAVLLYALGPGSADRIA